MRAWMGAGAILAPAILGLAGPAAAYPIPTIEPVYAVTVGATGVTVRLASNGCPDRSDFTVAISQNPPRPLVLFAHKHPERCQSPGAPVEFSYSFEDLGLKPGQPFSLANPLVSAP